MIIPVRMWVYAVFGHARRLYVIVLVPESSVNCCWNTKYREWVAVHLSLSVCCFECGQETEENGFLWEFPQGEKDKANYSSTWGEWKGKSSDHWSPSFLFALVKGCIEISRFSGRWKTLNILIVKYSTKRKTSLAGNYIFCCWVF